MNQMSKADEAAMCELASEMLFSEAAKFIRAQMSCPLTMAAAFAGAIARDFPDSPLAASVRAIDAG